MQETHLLLIIYGLSVGLAAGGLGGTLAALAGVGGGLIYVPVFYALMPEANQGLSMQILASMLAIVLTGGFSARSHYRLGHIDMAVSRQLLPGLILGAGFGLWSTLHIAEGWILIGLAALDAWVAFDYGHHVSAAHRPAGAWQRIALSAPIGYISGLFGIGGGTMLVPLLRRSLPLRMAVGSSAFCGLLMVVGSIALNLQLEMAWRQAMQQQIYFLSGALLGILMILPKTTDWAASLHDSLDEVTLRLILKGLFLGLSIALAMSAAIKLI